MPILDTGPCEPWPYICDDFPDSPTSGEQAVIDQAVEAATEALWHRTKRQFGTCSKTFRPCRDECTSLSPWLLPWPSTLDTSWGWPYPALVGGSYLNLACGSCSGGCSCSVLSTVRLPYPVAEVTEVLIDGAVLDPAAYRVDNYSILIRVDGGEWPRCNSLDKDDTEAGTWSVTASYGTKVPMLAQLAVGQLAGEIYKACPSTDSGKTCLPVGIVQSVTRQGVEMVMFDAETAFRRGRIGLYYADMFISTYNPLGTGTATFYNIDGPMRYNAGSLPGPTP